MTPLPRPAHLALTVLLLGLPVPLPAQAAADRLEAPLPAGWLRRTDGTQTHYVLAGDDETRIELHPVERVDGRTQREWFQQASAAARAGAALTSQGALTEERQGGGVVLLQGQLTRGGRTGTRYRYVAGLEQAGLRALLVLEALDEARFRGAVATFTALRRDARLIPAVPASAAAPGAGSSAGAGARPPAPGAEAGTLAGGWYGTELRSQLNWATGGYTYQQITYFFQLFADGRLRADAWGERTDGRWTVRGADVRLTLGTGTTYDLAWDRRQDRMTVLGAALERMRGEADRLEGSYGSESFTDVSSFGGATSGGVGGSVRLRFLPGQRFVLESEVGVTTTGAAGGGAAAVREVARGRYSLRDYRLRLQYDDGRTDERSAAVPAQGGDRPAFLMVGGATWLRR